MTKGETQMTLNPSKTAKGAQLWTRYAKEERTAEHMATLRSMTSQDRSAAWAKAQATYVAWRKAEGLPIEPEDEE